MLEQLRTTDPRTVGDYRLIARLPSGGMADVFLGQAPSGEVFAVKVAKADPDGVLADQFANEMRAARRAHGRYIAEVVGMGPHASPPWLATQYVPGPSLRDVVRGFGPLPEASVRALAVGLASALTSIHQSNLMHGDLTPANVLLVADGPRVIDFGISGMLEATTTAGHGPRFGTPGYVGPERLGPVPGKPTVASDMYSLGAVLWFASTGEPPNPLGTLRLDALPGSLRALVSSCLAADPGARPDPAAVLRQLLPAGAPVPSVFTDDWLPGLVQARIARSGAELDRLRSTAGSGPPHPPLATTTRLAGDPLPPVVRRRVPLGTIAAVVVALAAGTLVMWAVLVGRPGGPSGAAPDSSPTTTGATRGTGTDPRPCQREQRTPPLNELPFRCPIVWDARGTTLTSVPVFQSYTVANLTEAGQIDHLAAPAPQYFKCHIRGAEFHLPGQAGLAEAHHDWWAYTQGENDYWGFVPEVYLLGGDDYVPDGGLDLCTSTDLNRAGQR